MTSVNGIGYAPITPEEYPMLEFWSASKADAIAQFEQKFKMFWHKAEDRGFRLALLEVREIIGKDED